MSRVTVGSSNRAPRFQKNSLASRQRASRRLQTTAVVPPATEAGISPLRAETRPLSANQACSQKNRKFKPNQPQTHIDQGQAAIKTVIALSPAIEARSRPRQATFFSCSCKKRRQKNTLLLSASLSVAQGKPASRLQTAVPQAQTHGYGRPARVMAKSASNAYPNAVAAIKTAQCAARASNHPAPRFSTVLLQHPDPLHHHPLIHRLAHIVDGQQADLHGGQGFHFHAGLARQLDSGGAENGA